MIYIIATFYKFVTLNDDREIREKLKEYCQSQNIQGTILLAKEGINGTVAGSRESIDRLFEFLRQDNRFQDLEYKESTAQEPPFYRLKVRLKKEIVTLGIPEVNPGELVGTYVNPEEWNEIIEDPEVTVIDTRNNYEVEIGTFKGAINPETESFRQFPEYVSQKLDPKKTPKVAMFCTGGIRCEKASSLLKSQGFKEVYHLKGGILKYLEETPPEKSLWQGECFVFDRRVAVKEGLKPGSYDLCFGCGHPINDEDKQSPYYEDTISCPYCYQQLTPEKKARQIDKKRNRENIKHSQSQKYEIRTNDCDRDF